LLFTGTNFATSLSSKRKQTVAGNWLPCPTQCLCAVDCWTERVWLQYQPLIKLPQRPAAPPFLRQRASFTEYRLCVSLHVCCKKNAALLLLCEPRA
jgi:hypothetical protein